MKYLSTIPFLLLLSLSFGQEYLDTVAYKTEVVRAGEIVKVSGTVVKYEYRNL